MNIGRFQASSLPYHAVPVSLANDFNSFFVSKPIELHSVLFNSPTAELIHQNRQASHPSPTFPTLSSFHVVSLPVVESFIESSPRNSSSLDPVPTWLLYSHLPILSPTVVAIVNLAIRDGMPSVYKVASVTPLLKKKDSDPDLLSNYRPVSNLPFISKVIERVVAHQLVTHLESNNLLDPRQSAYRKLLFCLLLTRHSLPWTTKRSPCWFFWILVLHLIQLITLFCLNVSPFVELSAKPMIGLCHIYLTVNSSSHLLVSSLPSVIFLVACLKGPLLFIVFARLLLHLMLTTYSMRMIYSYLCLLLLKIFRLKFFALNNAFFPRR